MIEHENTIINGLIYIATKRNRKGLLTCRVYGHRFHCIDLLLKDKDLKGLRIFTSTKMKHLYYFHAVRTNPA